MGICKTQECITAVKGEKVLPLLRALRCKNGKSITCEAADTGNTNTAQTHHDYYIDMYVWCTRSDDSSKSKVFVC